MLGTGRKPWSSHARAHGWMGTWTCASKTTNNATGRRDVLLAPGAAGGRDTSVRPHPHTCANPGSQQPKARIIVSVPQMTKLWSRQDEVFAPKQGTESDLPFLRRPFRTCPAGLSPGPVLQDRWPWGRVHPGGSQPPLHSFPHSLGYSPKGFVALHLSRLFLSKMSHKMK